MVERIASGRPILALALAAALAGCAGSEPRIQAGPKAELTPDGLHKVDGVPFGTLYMKPDYAVGTYDHFVLGDTLITLKRGARPLDPIEVERVRQRFDEAARQAILDTGRIEAERPDACVALVNLALLDLDLLDPRELSGTRTAVMRSFGSLTLVLEIRDGYTGEPLLRYGRRRQLEGGVGLGADPAQGSALSAAFDRFAVDFRSDFMRSLPQVEPTHPPLTCTQRAGATPPVGAR